MSKMIKLTPECIDEVRRDFERVLSEVKVADGRISYTKTFGDINRKAIVYFTDIAWQKMQALIREFSTEVAWHGIAYRSEDKTKDEYFITDIIVYPQEVTGGTVNTDQEKYEMWLMMHDDDVFNNIRMQGHSHVNMGTTPSTVDITHQERILQQLDDNMFYIFMIWNKSGSKNIKIYDLEKNVMFDNYDISVVVQGDTGGLSAFLAEAKEMVQYKSYTPAATTTYTGAVGRRYGGSYAPASTTQLTTSSGKKSEPKSGESAAANSKGSDAGKRKGKRKGKGASKSGAVSATPATTVVPANASSCDDYDHNDDPYDPYRFFGCY